MDSKKHVVAGHSTCGWTTKQEKDLPNGSVMVMCDKNPEHAVCKGATAFPTHMMCQGQNDCTELAKGYKSSEEIKSMMGS